MIVIHGSGESAHAAANTIHYLTKGQGYGTHEVYAVTWGTPEYDGGSTDQLTYECSDMKLVRSFILAVLEYTSGKSLKVDVIAHSMGVPLTRQAIKGARW